MARKLLSGLFVIILLISTGIFGISCSKTNTTLLERFYAEYPKEEVKTMKWNSPPKMIIDTDKSYTATIEMAAGNITLELYAKDVPNTVNNFVFLALQKYYDGVTFHRVIPGFVAQGGDPMGTGMGGPGYGIATEVTSHKHVTGAISMAHSSLPDSNGSQFFICYKKLSDLDGGYSVFGQVTSGMEIVNAITPRDPDTSPNFTGDKIIKVTITEK
jgi:peptidylprolyl isomerase